MERSKFEETALELYQKYFDLYRDLTHKEKTVPSEIVPGELYLSGCKLAEDADLLKNFGIQSIVGIYEDQCNYPDFIRWILKIEVLDYREVDYSNHFETFLNFMIEQRENKRTVLIHCRSGSSRSVGFSILWLMIDKKMSLEEALEHVHSIRPIACPNLQLIQQLLNFEQSLIH